MSMAAIGVPQIAANSVLHIIGKMQFLKGDGVCRNLRAADCGGTARGYAGGGSSGAEGSAGAAPNAAPGQVAPESGDQGAAGTGQIFMYPKNGQGVGFTDYV
jgi:hypothetical protein